MHRFFSPDSDFAQDTITITNPNEIHHLRHVLRLGKGEFIRVFDGQGTEATGRILNVAEAAVRIKVTEIRHRQQGRPVVRLACAIPKTTKFEMIVEKCTELGIDEIVPLRTQRTEIRLSSEQAKRKTDRFYKVAVSAAKQCREMTLPMIRPQTEFRRFIERLDGTSPVLIPCLSGERKDLAELIRSQGPFREITFIIGPEGDFTPQELTLALEAGCLPVSLGPNVLRVETAAISVIAFINLWLNAL